MRPAVLVCLLACASARAQNPQQLFCEVTSEPRQIRSEGISELVGVIVLPCRGTPGATVTGSFNLIASAPVTNKITNDRIDAVMTADTATGTQTVGGSPFLGGGTNIVFGQFSFTMPATGRTSFTFGNIRVNPGSRDTVTVAISTTSGGVAITNARPLVAYVTRGLYAGNSTARIVCVRSPLPEDLTFLNLVWRGTQYATIRVTEGHSSAFEARQANTSNGTRVLIRLADFPARARIFVPDFVAGSSAPSPTSAGDLGLGASGGTYLGPGPGSSLLLGRVPGSDLNGGGSNPPLAGAGISIFNTVSEVHLVSGTGWVTYEVVDSVAAAIESAQIPLFIHLPEGAGQEGSVATARVTFAPLSTVSDASASAPLVRFRDVAPPQDCNILRDCNSGYFPRLVVEAQTLAVVAPASIGNHQRRLKILNEGGGQMPWSSSIQYKNGADWLKLFPAAGLNTSDAALNFHPEKLTPGSYEATLVIDAGPLAGQRTFNVRLDVTNPLPTPPPNPEPPPNRPRFWGVGNAANLGIGTVVPGSMAVLDGTRLSGRSVEVRFGGVAAEVVSIADARLRVIVPADLGTQSETQIVVTVDGLASEAVKAPVAISAPAIFQGAVYNQDGFANAASNPERAGNIIQVFATGLPLPALGTISVRIHDRDITQLLFAGPAPGSPGVQQVNVRIPEDLPPMNSEVRVCGAPLTAPSQTACSAGMALAIREPE